MRNQGFSKAMAQWVSCIQALRVNLQHGRWSRTMEDGLCSWSNFYGLIPLKKNQFTEPLGPSLLGVNWMWTTRDDHAPKSECVDLFNVCPKRAYLKMKVKIKFDHSLVFSCHHLLFPPKKNIIRNLIWHHFSAMGPCLFFSFYYNTSFASPIAKSIGLRQ